MYVYKTIKNTKTTSLLFLFSIMFFLFVVSNGFADKLKEFVKVQSVSSTEIKIPYDTLTTISFGDEYISTHGIRFQYEDLDHTTTVDRGKNYLAVSTKVKMIGTIHFKDGNIISIVLIPDKSVTTTYFNAFMKQTIGQSQGNGSGNSTGLEEMLTVQDDNQYFQDKIKKENIKKSIENTDIPSYDKMLMYIYNYDKNRSGRYVVRDLTQTRLNYKIQNFNFVVIPMKVFEDSYDSAIIYKVIVNNNDKVSVELTEKDFIRLAKYEIVKNKFFKWTSILLRRYNIDHEHIASDVIITYKKAVKH